MKKFLSFACALSIFAVVSARGQAISRVPGSDPFRIDQGSSFSASTKRRAPVADPPVSTAAAGKIVSDVEQALDLIRRNHVDGERVDDGQLTKFAVSGMLAELDPHSSYFDADEFSELLGEQDSEYSGTGSTISNFARNGVTETYILSTHPDSSAAKANLQYGDRIVSVNGMPVSGLASEIVRDKVRGPRGTFVRMSIERAATGLIETIDLRRERIFQPTLPNYFIVRDGVAYIDLTEGFSNTTSAEFAAALRELHRRGMSSLILDLRGNSGGILDQAVKTAEEFLPAGSTIISQRGRSPIDDREWRSGNKNPENIPLVVLVDDQTASASEVVAGALQDNDRALIIGQTTFGKGLVQNVLDLPLGSGLTLTTARYYTPSGRSIQRTYAGTGTYDYFNHRSSPGGAGPETHTVTNRIVYGGNGITPDEVFQSEKFDAKKAALLDPIFFFVKELVNQKQRTKDNSISSRDAVRQSIIFGAEPLGKQLLQKFIDYATQQYPNISAHAINEYSGFVTQRLNYELALATFGPGSAKHAQILSDAEIAIAVDALPRASRLAESARRVRNASDNKKTRRVAFPTGQGRNRRN
ncbi:MAG TPA: S41 family peptidase [Pyrinomonadaceae bacterium]|nr:S41 family peptidase [Pyrinomonadaceae bacterium]